MGPCFVFTQCGLLRYHLLPLFSVVCIVIICLCLAGTVADLCVVQGSWKFWLLPDMPSGIASSLSSQEREESAPLLQGNGFLNSSNSTSQIQFKQHSVGERGKDGECACTIFIQNGIVFVSCCCRLLCPL